MPGFESVVGLSEIVAYLQKAIAVKKVAQTYIFYGEAGSGKKLLAGIFAMTLLCERGGVDPCLECSSCHRVQTGNHPDLITVTHENPKLITVKDIRTQVVGDVQIRPAEGGYKIYIIPQADRMGDEAQNALLKTLEELPEYAMILLLADNVEKLLPTIRSRCVHLHMRPVRDEQVADYLRDTCHEPERYVAADTALAGGNIGKARELAGDEGSHDRIERAVNLLKRSYHMPVQEVMEGVAMLTAEKGDIGAYLELFTLWFRDVLLFKATAEADRISFRNETAAIRQRAGESSYEGLDAILAAIDTARARLEANVSFDLAVELLLLSMREN